MKVMMKKHFYAFAFAGLTAVLVPGQRAVFAEEVANDSPAVLSDATTEDAGDVVVPLDDSSTEYDADRDHDNQCRWFDGNPYRCQRDPGCSYDYRNQRCVAQFGGGHPDHDQPQPYFCQRFNYNQFQCQRNGCSFDYSSQRCFSRGGSPQPHPGGRGIVCSAVDVRWEEHSGGHRGVGIDQYSAQQAAMGDCLRHHYRCRITQCQAY